MSAPENPAAFPCTGEGYGSSAYTQYGMTLRDWFAGQAIGAIIGATASGQHMPGGYVVDDKRSYPTRFAADAYDIADAMLAAREHKA